MNKKKLIAAGVVVLAVVVGLLAFCLHKQSEPSLSDLRAEDIERIDAVWGDQPYYRALSAEDQELLVGYLQQVELGERVSNFLDYDGVMGEMFSLRMKSGETMIVAASSPLFVVDGVGYRCDSYDVCKAVSKMYWRYADVIRAENPKAPTVTFADDMKSGVATQEVVVGQNVAAITVNFDYDIQGEDMVVTSVGPATAENRTGWHAVAQTATIDQDKVIYAQDGAQVTVPVTYQASVGEGYADYDYAVTIDLSQA